MGQFVCFALEMEGGACGDPASKIHFLAVAVLLVYGGVLLPAKDPALRNYQDCMLLLFMVARFLFQALARSCCL